MEPIGAFTRPKGEHVIVHHCLTCGFERHNRIAGDDDFELVLKLPVVPAPLDSPKAARASSSAQMHDAGPATDSGEPRSERHEGPHDD